MNNVCRLLQLSARVGAFALITATLACASATAPQRKPGTSQSERTSGRITLGQTIPAETSLGSPHLPASHEVWMKTIGAAKRSIDIAQFYVANKPGSRLDAVLRLIASKASQGVRVRMLVEEVFAKRYPQALQRLATVKGVEVRMINGRRAYGGGILHAKYFIVDGETAWIGSQNFDWRALEHIHEVGALIEHQQLVGQMVQIFTRDWGVAAGHPAAAHGSSDEPVYVSARHGKMPVEIALAFSPPAAGDKSTAWDLPEIERWIQQAKESVSLQLLSMKHKRRGGGGPWLRLHAALRDAAARGVAVKVLVAHWSQHHIAELCRQLDHPNIEVRFLTVPEAKGGFVPFSRVIHAKYMVIDSERGWLGTSNWAHGYFFQSRNVSVFVKGKSFAHSLAQVFSKMWTSAHATAAHKDSSFPKPRIAK